MFSARKSLSAILPAILAICATLLTVPVVIGFWGEIHPAFDSFAHFRVHLSVLILLLALPCMFFPGWRTIGAAAAVLALAAIGSALIPNSGGMAHAGSVSASDDLGVARYRLLHLNLRYDNGSPKAVLSLIGRTGADVVTLNEVSAMWRGELETIEAAYPHRIFCPGPTRIGGVAILSRRPFLHPATARCFDRGSLAVATVNFGGTAVDIAALHLGWPWPYDRRQQMRDVAPPLERLGSASILAGDLNSAPWSARARQIARAGKLTVLGDIGPTWLLLPLPDLLRRTAGLPLDNVFVKGGVVPIATRRLEDTGSDHLPVLVEFRLRLKGGPGEVLKADLGK